MKRLAQFLSATGRRFRILAKVIVTSSGAVSSP